MALNSGASEHASKRAEVIQRQRRRWRTDIRYPIREAPERSAMITVDVEALCSKLRAARDLGASWGASTAVRPYDTQQRRLD